ncbi:archaeosortase/exosortase family protein [Alkalinema sp. FACHB-956]|uniref:archaeosortase/exosortase family protein n=1 Tax=Alkalinema sp. FACHB-956 TaxID=2692768 RepID=UPI001685B944|nr:archaeosortase/exosortase family protein [Alkalinema sp. FACHB-956]MBD2325538.1 archaeosortase/exosortase family protein [Alkalinema sp. FACHB-956]
MRFMRPAWTRRYLLVWLGVGLIFLHLVLIWKVIGETDQLVISLVFWSAIVTSLWQRHDRLKLKSGMGTILLGGSLLGLLLFKCLSLFQCESDFVRIFPIWAVLSLGLIASGWKFHQYAREGLLVATLIIPPGVIFRLVDVSIGDLIRLVIAKLASLFLYYAGYNSVQIGVKISLNNNIIEVGYPCTGIPMMVLLIQLTIVFNLMTQFSKIHKILLLGFTVVMSVILSSVRVMIMALVVKDQAAFDYWHGAQGAQIFSTIAFILFALACRWLLSRSSAEANDEDGLEDDYEEAHEEEYEDDYEEEYEEDYENELDGERCTSQHLSLTNTQDIITMQDVVVAGESWTNSAIEEVAMKSQICAQSQSNHS